MKHKYLLTIVLDLVYRCYNKLTRLNQRANMWPGLPLKKMDITKIFRLRKSVIRWRYPHKKGAEIFGSDSRYHTYTLDY